MLGGSKMFNDGIYSYAAPFPDVGKCDEKTNFIYGANQIDFIILQQLVVSLKDRIEKLEEQVQVLKNK